MKTELKYDLNKTQSKIAKEITENIVNNLKKELLDINCKNHPDKSTIEISIKEGDPEVRIKNVCCDEFKNIVSDKVKSILPQK